MNSEREKRERESTLASGWTVSTEPSVSGEATSLRSQPTRQRAESAAPESHPSQSERQAIEPGATEISNMQLVLFGVFGGLYLLYTVGWFFVAQFFASANSVAASSSGIVGGILQQVLFWSAALAPVLWFFASIMLARGRRPWFLPTAFLLGVIVLLPLPLFVVGEA